MRDDTMNRLQDMDADATNDWADDDGKTRVGIPDQHVPDPGAAEHHPADPMAPLQPAEMDFDELVQDECEDEESTFVVDLFSPETPATEQAEPRNAARAGLFKPPTVLLILAASLFVGVAVWQLVGSAQADVADTPAVADAPEPDWPVAPFDASAADARAASGATASAE